MTNSMFMRTRQDKTQQFADLRSLVEIIFGLVSFGALVCLIIHKFAESNGATESLSLVHYFAVRAALSGLMIYSGIKSSGRNPLALSGLNLGIGLSSLFLGIMNILEYALAGGDWMDVVTAILYTSVGLVILYTTLYLRQKTPA